MRMFEDSVSDFLQHPVWNRTQSESEENAETLIALARSVSGFTNSIAEQVKVKKITVRAFECGNGTELNLSYILTNSCPENRLGS